MLVWRPSRQSKVICRHGSADGTRTRPAGMIFEKSSWSYRFSRHRFGRKSCKPTAKKTSARRNRGYAHVAHHCTVYIHRLRDVRMTIDCACVTHAVHTRTAFVSRARDSSVHELLCASGKSVETFFASTGVAVIISPNANCCGIRSVNDICTRAQ